MNLEPLKKKKILKEELVGLKRKKRKSNIININTNKTMGTKSSDTAYDIKQANKQANANWARFAFCKSDEDLNGALSRIGG